MAWSGIAGKTVVITGGSGGIGYAAAQELVARGANVGIVARDASKAAVAAGRLAAGSGVGAAVQVFIADLSSQASVRRLADEVLERYPRLDALVNNAGAVFQKRQVTADGIERTWALNHLAPFLLTNLLLDRLVQNAPARVVTTASDAHRTISELPFDDLDAERSYRGFARYGQSKLANILFTAELARRLADTGVTATCFHPGFVASGFNRNNGAASRLAMRVARLAARTPSEGADTLVWLLDSAGASGGYYVDRQLVEPASAARDNAAARRLWQVSEGQTAAHRAPGRAAPDDGAS